MEIRIEYLNKIKDDINKQTHNILNLDRMGYELTANAEDIDKLNDAIDCLKIAISMIKSI